MVEADEPRLARWEGDGPAGSPAAVSYRLEPEDGGTRFEYENEFALPGGVLGKVAGGLLSAAPGGARRGARSSACARCSSRHLAAARAARRRSARANSGKTRIESIPAPTRADGLLGSHHPVSVPISVIATTSGSAAAENSASEARSVGDELPR